jgi:hypothetical protein
LTRMFDQLIVLESWIWRSTTWASFVIFVSNFLTAVILTRLLR